MSTCVTVNIQELSTAVISQWRKEAMRSTLKTFKKTIIDADKATKAKLVQKVSCVRAPHSPMQCQANNIL